MKLRKLDWKEYINKNQLNYVYIMITFRKYIFSLFL